MNWGVFVSLSTLGGIVGFILLAIIVLGLLWFLLTTPWGLVVIGLVVVVGLIRLFRPY